MRTWFAAILTAWSLLVAPGLCLEGDTPHDCKDHPAESDGHHEPACPSDPCNVSVTLPAQRVQQGLLRDAYATLSAVALSTLAGSITPTCCDEETALEISVSPNLFNLPYPASERPLRL